MGYCWKCGAKLPDNAAFCEKCGTKQKKMVEDPFKAIEKPRHVAPTAPSGPVKKPNEKKKKRKGGKFFLILLVIIVMILLLKFCA